MLLAEKEDDEIYEMFGESLSPKEFDDLMTAIVHVREHGFLVHKQRNIAMGIGAPATAGIAFSGESVISSSMNILSDIRAIVASVNEKIGQVVG